MGTWYENKIEYNRKYEKKNVKQVVVKFNRNTEDDIINFIETLDNKQGYIKQLIRNDMKTNGRG